MRLDEGSDVSFEFRSGAMDTELLLLAGQLCKPPFNLIDPGSGSRREVDVPVWAARQPSLNFPRLVGGIVVHHEVDVRPVGHRGVDALEEVEELGRPMVFIALADDGTGGNVERREQ